jgi:hydrogenase-4 component E
MQEIGIIANLSLLMVITTIAVIEIRNLRFSAYAYISQALLMCSIFFVFGRLNENIYYWLVVAFFTKAVIIPFMLLRTISKTKEIEVKPIIGRIPSIIISLVILAVFYKLVHTYADFAAPKTADFDPGAEPFRTNLAVAFTIFVLGLYCIIGRRDALKEVQGLCIMENGIHLSLITLAPTLKETVLIGIVTDVVFAVYVILYIIRGIHKEFGTTDTYQLKNLRW